MPGNEREEAVLGTSTELSGAAGRAVWRRKGDDGRAGSKRMQVLIRDRGGGSQANLLETLKQGDVSPCVVDGNDHRD